jgi:hypothetical protein
MRDIHQLPKYAICHPKADTGFTISLLVYTVALLYIKVIEIPMEQGEKVNRKGQAI